MAWWMNATMVGWMNATFLNCCRRGLIYVVRGLVRIGADTNAKEEDSGLTALMLSSGHIKVAKYLVEAGANVNAQDKNGRSALMYAAHSGNSETVKYLVEAGADVNAQDKNGRSVLIFAANGGYSDIVKYLVQDGQANVNAQSKDGLSALMVATNGGYSDTVKYLVEGGQADVNAKDKIGQSVLMNAAHGGKSDIVKYLVEDGQADVNEQDKEGWSALIIAASGGYSDIVQYLVKNGKADVNAQNKDGQSVLMCAVHGGYGDIVKYLLQDGQADVNAQDKKGQSALIISTILGRVNIVKYLVEAKSDANAQDKDGVSVLMFAAEGGSSDIVTIVKYLVEDGQANVNAQDKLNQSALWLAAKNGHSDIVKYLIYKGADVNMKAKPYDDCTIVTSAIMQAAICGHKESVQALIDAGANIHETSGETEEKTGTVLTYAALGGEKDIFLAVHEAGATEEVGCVISLLSHCVSNGSTELSQLIGDLVADDVKKPHNLRVFKELLDQLSIWHIDSVRTLVLLSDKFKIPFEITETRIPFQDAIYYSSHSGDSALCEEGALLTDANTLPEDILHLPTVSELINCPGIGNISCLPNGSGATISEFTDNIVHEIINQLNSNNGESEQSRAIVDKCGSAAEGTKLIMPDEFDYAVKFKIDTETRASGQIVDFKYLGYDDGYKLCSFRKTTSTWNIPKMEGSKIFHVKFSDKLHRAISTHQSIEERASDQFVKGGGQANSIIKIIWPEPETNNKLRISVDMVPVLHFDDEWPDYLTQKTWMMDREMLKSRGFCLVAKPPHADSALGKSMSNNGQENKRTKLWRISFSHLEAEHIASLPPRVRDAYVAAKCLRNPDVCRIMFRDKDGILNNVDKYVTSYMLKTAFLHNVEDFLKNEKSLIEMVDIIYRDLEGYLDKDFIPLFWQPSVNNQAGLKYDLRKVLRATKLMREFVGRLKTREMESEAVGTESDGKMTGHQSSLVSDADPSKSKEGKEVSSDNKLPRQCLPALCPLGYYVFPEDDIGTEEKSQGLGD